MRENRLSGLMRGGSWRSSASAYSTYAPDHITPAHADFAKWYGEGSLFHLIAHAFHEGYDPGPGSALDKATAYAFLLALKASRGRELPADVFVYTDQLTKNTQSGEAYAAYIPTAEQLSRAQGNVKIALDNVIIQYKKLQEELSSGEYARRASFFALLDLKDAYQGSLLLPRKWLKKFMQGGGQVTLVA